MTKRAQRDRDFGEYVAERRAHLYRTAYLLCGEAHRAEDIVQQALTKLYAAWPRAFGNNSVVPVEGMDIPVDALVRAAADERLTPATPEQIRNAGTSMGFPDFDELRPGAEGASENPVPAAPQ